MKHRTTGVRASVFAALLLAWALPAEAGIWDILTGDENDEEQAGEEDERHGRKYIDV